MLCYKDERDKDFFNNCLLVEKELFEQVKQSTKNRRGYMVSPRQIFTSAILRPAQSFYLADALQILKIYKKAQQLPELPDTPRGALYADIRNEFSRLKQLHPDYSLLQIAGIIEDLPAPRFYISENWAQMLFYTYQRKYYGKK